MATATYSISLTTMYTEAAASHYSADPTQVYGVLFSDTSMIAWPSTLTRISISGLTATHTISTTTKTEYPSGKPTSHIFGQYYRGESPVPWPTSSTGIVTVPAETKSTPSTITSQTTAAPTVSVVSETGPITTEGTGSITGTGEAPKTTSSSSPSAPSHSTGLTTGATAGIAIGCVLAGLAIGLIAAFFLFRRKGKRNASVDGVVIQELHNKPKAYPSGKGTPVNDIQLTQFLLEATPDREIVQEVQSIGALIHQHIEAYYHTRPITVDTRALASTLAHLGFPSTTNSASFDAQSASNLCLDPRTRQTGLRHVIMRVLFSSIDTHTPHGPSMLPAPVIPFLRAIPPAESDRFADPQANSLALRKWRNLSAFLLHPTRSHRTSLPIGDAAVALQAQELAKSLNSFLRFFAEGQQQQQQVGHLQAVIAECAKLGYMLFSHPSDWGFVYEVGATQGVVVEAGLDKLGDRDGAPYPSPRRLVEPVAVSYQSGH